MNKSISNIDKFKIPVLIYIGSDIDILNLKIDKSKFYPFAYQYLLNTMLISFLH